MPKYGREKPSRNISKGVVSGSVGSSIIDVSRTGNPMLHAIIPRTIVRKIKRRLLAYVILCNNY